MQASRPAARAGAIRVSPNPFTSSVNISLDTDTREIAVYDISGRLVENLTARGRSFSWNGTGRPAGIYLLRVKTAKGLLQKKLFLYQ